MSERGSQEKGSRQVLKRLREERASQVKAANAANAIVRGERKKILAHMNTDPMSVRQVAEASGLPTDRVLWHFAAMRKYGKIVEAPDKDGDFYTYVLTPEARTGGRGKSRKTEAAADKSDAASEES